jgi:hypothetical protein
MPKKATAKKTKRARKQATPSEIASAQQPEPLADESKPLTPDLYDDSADDLYDDDDFYNDDDNDEPEPPKAA